MSGSGEKTLAAEAEVIDPEEVKDTPVTKDEKAPEKEPRPPFSNYLVRATPFPDRHAY